MLTADELIDSYVADVVSLLPRRQRRDVAQELRTLLHDELDAVAGETTREAAARDLLAGFGHPAEVAARYGSPVAVIDPVDTRRFLSLALGGSAVILFGALLGELIKPERDLRRAIDPAWPVVFGWLGLLLVGFAAAAWVRRRQSPGPAWKPRPVPTDRINRWARAAGIVLGAIGTLILVDPPAALRFVTGGRAAQAAYDALAYDEEFLRLRGPVLLALLIVSLVIQAALVWLGRWRPTIRTADLVFGLVLCAVLT